MNERISSIRDRAFKSVRQPNVESEESEDEPPIICEAEIICEAKRHAHYYRTCPVVVNDGELIVGDYPRVVLAEIQQPTIFGRQSFEGGRGWGIPDDLAKYFKHGLLSWAGNHKTLDYETVFAGGFNGICLHIDDRITRLDRGDPSFEEKNNFLLALKIVAQAYGELSTRYADYTHKLSKIENDFSRRKELDIISNNCSRVPANPPTNFWEACQCLWFSFFLVPDAPGRIDQYLHPYYMKDIERGTLTREFAKELLSCLWIKYFEHVGPQSGVSAHNHLTLGGVTSNGDDATNAVTQLCLEVTAELKLQRPQIGLLNQDRRGVTLFELVEDPHFGRDPDTPLLRRAERATPFRRVGRAHEATAGGEILLFQHVLGL